MEVAYVVFALGVLLTVPLAVWVGVDWFRTRRWVRTVGWDNLVGAMMEGQPSYAAALYIVYRDNLRTEQCLVVEAYLAAERERAGVTRAVYTWGGTPVPEWSTDAEVCDAADREMDEDSRPLEK